MHWVACVKCLCIWACLCIQSYAKLQNADAPCRVAFGASQAAASHTHSDRSYQWCTEHTQLIIRNDYVTVSNIILTLSTAEHSVKVNRRGSSRFRARTMPTQRRVGWASNECISCEITMRHAPEHAGHTSRCECVWVCVRYVRNLCMWQLFGWYDIPHNLPISIAMSSHRLRCLIEVSIVVWIDEGPPEADIRAIVAQFTASIKNFDKTPAMQICNMRCVYVCKSEGHTSASKTY